MTKPQIRELYLKKRRHADPERIANQLGEIFAKSPIKLLHSFIGNQAKNEVDTKHIRQILQAKFPEVQWAAPRMIPGARHMESYIWNNDTELSTNRHGIEEPNPETSQFIEIPAIDAVLVPLLAFDKLGHRVGYGGGYYDRFLAHCRPNTLKIGLSQFEPIEEIEDTNEWDVTLDICVTPDRIHRWN